MDTYIVTCAGNVVCDTTDKSAADTAARINARLGNLPCSVYQVKHISEYEKCSDISIPPDSVLFKSTFGKLGPKSELYTAHGWHKYPEINPPKLPEITDYPVIVEYDDQLILTMYSYIPAETFGHFQSSGFWRDESGLPDMSGAVRAWYQLPEFDPNATHSV